MYLDKIGNIHYYALVYYECWWKAASDELPIWRHQHLSHMMCGKVYRFATVIYICNFDFIFTVADH